MPQLLRTRVSRANWCTSQGQFQPASVEWMKQPRGGGGEIYWLDRLLEGGIVLPNLATGQKRALTILITGPPGAGKSTLALEFCYRWTDGYIEEIEPSGQVRPVAGSTPGLASLYVTSESDERWLFEKASSLGWKVHNRFWNEKTRAPDNLRLINVWPTRDLQQYFRYRMEVPALQALLESIGNLLPINLEPVTTEALGRHAAHRVIRRIGRHAPVVVVIDSLNTVESELRSELFKRFLEVASSGPRVLIMIIEAEEPAQAAFWEYVADMVIRLDVRRISEYQLRTIEIVKARYQPHIWGAHQLKFYGHAGDDSAQPAGRRASLEARRRAHPYRDEGGITVFPSIHYYLSVYKRRSPVDVPKSFETPLASLNRILNGGLPQGRCTGLYGIRGGHKSHLGYLSLLDKIRSADGRFRALVISLRDDEGLARGTMEKILRQQLGVESPKADLQRLEQEDLLEILYYPPGYITPEEFFHRMFVSVQRLKSQDDHQLVVLFNSLDQLPSRFPLCAREQIFIPGIIEMLTAEEVTSLFIAVDEPGQPPEQYGLRSMADALISFEQRSFTQQTYLSHALAARPQGCFDEVAQRQICERLGPVRQPVTLRVVRFAGGQEAGAGGFLELVDDESDPRFELLGGSGLHFIPFSPHYSHGDPVRS